MLIHPMSGTGTSFTGLLWKRGILRFAGYVRVLKRRALSIPNVHRVLMAPLGISYIFPFFSWKPIFWPRILSIFSGKWGHEAIGSAETVPHGASWGNQLGRVVYSSAASACKAMHRQSALADNYVKIQGKGKSERERELWADESGFPVFDLKLLELHRIEQI